MPNIGSRRLTIDRLLLACQNYDHSRKREALKQAVLSLCYDMSARRVRLQYIRRLMGIPCGWCGTDPDVAAARYEGPHATWCVYYRRPPLPPGCYVLGNVYRCDAITLAPTEDPDGRT